MDPLSSFLNRGAEIFNKLREDARQIKKEQKELERREKQLLKEAQKIREESSTQQVAISTSSVVKAAAAVLALLALSVFLIEIHSIIILFLIAGFLATTMEPAVARLRSFGLPRGLGVILMYILFFIFFGLVLSAFVPILTKEIPNLATQLLAYAQNTLGIDTTYISSYFSDLEFFFSDIQSNLTGLTDGQIQAGVSALMNLGANTFSVLQSVAGGLFSIGFMLVISFFMVLEEDGIKRFLMQLFPRKYHGYIVEKAQLIETKFGEWFRGQLLLMLSMGTLTFIMLKILGVQYPLSLSLLAAFAELLPYIGPILALIPALIIAFSQDGMVFAGIVLGAYLVLQQIEGNVLVPLIMKRAVGLSPVVIIFAMLVGASFPNVINPIVGLILAVPVATALSVFVMDYAARDK